MPKSKLPEEAKVIRIISVFYMFLVFHSAWGSLDMKSFIASFPIDANLFWTLLIGMFIANLIVLIVIFITISKGISWAPILSLIMGILNGGSFLYFIYGTIIVGALAPLVIVYILFYLMSVVLYIFASLQCMKLKFFNK